MWNEAEMKSWTIRYWAESTYWCVVLVDSNQLHYTAYLFVHIAFIRPLIYTCEVTSGASKNVHEDILFVAWSLQFW